MGSSFNLLQNCIGYNYCNGCYFSMILSWSSHQPYTMSVFPELHHIPRCLQTLGCKRVQETEACSQSRCNCAKSYLPPLWADIQGSNDIKQSLWKCDLVISGLGVERRALPLWRTIYFGWHQHGLEECFRHKIDNMILFQAPNISKILKILETQYFL